MKKIKNLVINGKNSLTLILLRFFLAFIVFLLIHSSRNKLALYLFAVTAFVAFLDGFLAKRNRRKRQLRSILDPLADKVVINLVAVSLFLKGIIPFWLMIAYLAKDLSVIFGALFILIKNLLL